ncbi:MAG: hypothetical protein QGI45_05555 [Myxococcota bacterium]|jgi:hypothetical protein|nr:hypothetical protein [Myxococcota bacterium]
MASITNIESQPRTHQQLKLTKNVVDSVKLTKLSDHERSQVNGIIDRYIAGKATKGEKRFLANMGLLTGAQNDLPLTSISEHGMAMLSQVQSELSGIIQNPQNPVSDSLTSRWSEFIADVASNKGGMVDINSLVQMVLREAYTENTTDLHFYAQKVRYFNEVKKAMREELTRARDALTQTAGQEDDYVVNYASTNVETEAFGNVSEISGEIGAGKILATKADLDNYIQGLEEKLNSVGDDAQLANVDLQNMLQKQQQTLQMMSNIAKMLHDTAMAVIRKIGG